MIFPRADAIPRHPSQIYQALLEGLALFLIMFLLSRREMDPRSVRDPDRYFSDWIRSRADHRGNYFESQMISLGFLTFGATMGQLLSIPMLLAGLWLALRRKAPDSHSRNVSLFRRRRSRLGPSLDSLCSSAELVATRPHRHPIDPWIRHIGMQPGETSVAASVPG